MSEPNDPLSSYSGARVTPAPPESVAGTGPEMSQRPEGGDAEDREQHAPAPWTPQTTAAPSAEDDEALRQERARRFGPSRDEGGDPAGGSDPAGVPGEEEPASTFEDSGPATTAFGPGSTELLAEEESAHTPTGPVTPLPASPAGGIGSIGAVPATRSMPSTPVAHVSPPEPAEPADPFEGFNEGPESRAAAHWWVVLVSLVFVPVAWYLLADGGERLSWSIEHSETVNVWAYVELGAGLLAAIIVLLAARWSSVGPIILGSITALLGAAYLAFPDRAQDFLADYAEIFTRLGQFGQNVLDHLQRDAVTGRLLTFGVVLIMAGVISHGARRQGRREERIRSELEG
ncbi:hypothetical protein [Pseudactinotalea sp. HY158]|uniref:hypothetical protein n=1 Tax=Pseudactinotalea sp. HY158 TaxID=2654547 RepID=UPI00129C4412|nr:hypothetical protein [Pseudactinotalea sp. HY158]QGH68365.1 hypothetical protein GCE65_01700 [Pseudactinotalea sp. HY158]